MMGENWNLSGLILEGVCGSGKTTILKALLTSDRFVSRSFPSCIALSEHQTQRVLERKEREEGLTPQDNVSLLNQHVTYLENLHDRLGQMQWREDNRTNMRVPYLFERFHFTHVCHYDGMCWRDVQDIDARLARLNCRLCLLALDESMMERRIITRRDSGWRDYLSGFGKTDEEILRHFSGQQQMLSDLCARSQLATKVVDTSASTVEETLDEVLDFWGAV